MNRAFRHIASFFQMGGVGNVLDQFKNCKEILSYISRLVLSFLP